MNAAVDPFADCFQAPPLSPGVTMEMVEEAAPPPPRQLQPVAVIPTPEAVVLRTVNLEDVEMRSIEWVDRPFLQASAFHLIAGKKGAGKGTWLARQIALVTTGKLLDRPANVLVLATEDSASIDLKPRIVAAGGLPNRVDVIKEHVLLPRDVLKIVKTAKEIGNVGLIIIDPIANHLGGENTDGEGKVRDAIAPLNDVADVLGCIVLGVRHLTKNTGPGALASVLGSTAWVDVPRAVLVAAADDEDDLRFHVQTVAGNRGPRNSTGREYRIELRDVGLKEMVTYAAEVGDSSKNVDDLLVPRTKTSGSAAARELILDELTRAGGRMESDALDAVIAGKAGIATKTVQNIRTKLKNEGLIRNVPDRDAGGAVKCWFVALTNAPDPSHAQGDKKSVPSVSGPLGATTTSRDPVPTGESGSSVNGHHAEFIDDAEMARLQNLFDEHQEARP